MNVTHATSGRLMKVIQTLCAKCAEQKGISPVDCDEKTCEANCYRFAHVQLSLFGGTYREQWLACFCRVAREKFRGIGFYPSEIRAAVEKEFGGMPEHPSWIGSACRALVSSGWRRTGQGRASPLKQCNGRMEFRYVYEAQ